MSAERYEYLLEIIKNWENEPIFSTVEGGVLSYSDFLKRAVRRLNFLIDRGVKCGDRIMVSLDNSTDFLELFVALGIGGMTMCPVDPALSITQTKKARAVSMSAMAISSYEDIGLSDSETLPDAAFLGELNAPFLLGFSSGTTGAPKGIVQGFHSFFEGAKAFSSLAKFGKGKKTLHNWPMFYNAGLFNLFASPFVSGGKIEVVERFSAKNIDNFWKNVDRYAPDYIYLSPTMAATLIHTFRFFKVDNQIFHGKKIISTSSILYPSIRNEFERLFGVSMLPCYGITEMGGSFTIGSETKAPYSVGKIINGVEVITENGEIKVRSPYAALFYISEGGSLTPIGVEEFFSTGDLGRFEGNDLLLSGRKGDFIKKGGEMINLGETEDLVLASGFCRECSAVGRPDVFWGEVYDLYVVPKVGDDKNETKDKICRLTNEKLPQSLRPAEIHVIDEIPKTASGKPLKRMINYTEVGVA